jgi:rhodanese-related sulfurtransferase
MPFTADDVESNRRHFAAKLRAEKQMSEAVTKVKEGRGDFILLDTRARDAYRKAHILGAWSVPLAEIAALAPHIPKDRELVTYCWSHH